jgi:hypothetical protein
LHPAGGQPDANFDATLVKRCCHLLVSIYHLVDHQPVANFAEISCWHIVKLLAFCKHAGMTYLKTKTWTGIMKFVKHKAAHLQERPY